MEIKKQQSLLKVSGLNVIYSSGPNQPSALADVEFSLDPGRTLGVVGTSGAGKTTLALAVSGLLDREAVQISGTVRYRDHNILKLSEKELSCLRGNGIAMIFQDPVASLDPAQRVIEQVAEVFRIKSNADRKKARKMARQELLGVGFTPEALASAPYAHQLSGGQCQRVMIAAALAGKPSLLVADEPTSSLDAILQAQIIKLIKQKQHHSGMAMIFISHDLPLVTTVADEILVMSHGKVVERGDCKRVLSEPKNSFTAEMINAGTAIGPWRGVEVVNA